jgi:integrase
VEVYDGALRQMITLGPWGSDEANDEYQRLLARQRAGRSPATGAKPADDLSVSEALLKYVEHVEDYYRDADGKPTGTAADIRRTLVYLRTLFGELPLAEFGPPALVAVRQRMVDDGRVRTQVNKRVSQVRQFFKWCVAGQLCPPPVLTALQAVRPLAEGRCGVKSGKEVTPADPVAVDRVLPVLPPAVRAVVKLLRLTGARPSEILNLRVGELDRTATPWRLTPKKHKTAWRGKARAIFFGAEARAVLTPWLENAGDGYVFSPSRSEQARGVNRARGHRYDFRTFARAVRRGCVRAGVVPFTPYQLRHLRATEIAEAYGLEEVRAVLGHGARAMAHHYARAADDTIAARVAEAG